jgi:hypothetical protein
MLGSEERPVASVLDASVLDLAWGGAGRKVGLCSARGGGVATGFTMAGAGMKMLSGGLAFPGGCRAIASIGVGAGLGCQVSRFRFLICGLRGAPAAM